MPLLSDGELLDDESRSGMPGGFFRGGNFEGIEEIERGNMEIYGGVWEIFGEGWWIPVTLFGDVEVGVYIRGIEIIKIGTRGGLDLYTFGAVAWAIALFFVMRRAVRGCPDGFFSWGKGMFWGMDWGWIWGMGWVIYVYLLDYYVVVCWVVIPWGL